MRRFIGLLLGLSVAIAVWPVTSTASAALPTSVVSIETQYSTVTVGDQVSVNLTATSAAELYGIELKVHYDAAVLKLEGTTSTTYSFYQSDLTAEGLLYVSGIAKSGVTRSGEVKLLTLNFKAHAVTAHSGISVQVVKGVTHTPTTRVVNGVTYPDVVGHPVASGAGVVLAIQSKGSNSGGSVPLPDDSTPTPGTGPRDDTAVPFQQAQQEANQILTSLRSAIKNQALGGLSPIQAASLAQQASSAIAGLTREAASMEQYELTADQIKATFDLLEQIYAAAASLGLQLVTSAADLVYKIEFPSVSLSFAWDKLADTTNNGTILTATSTNVQTVLTGNARYTPHHQAMQIKMGGTGQRINYSAQWLIPESVRVDLVGVYKLNEGNGQWDYIRESTHDNQSITVELTGSGTYALMTFTRHYEDIGATYAEAAEAIEWLTARHIVSGVNATDFAPKKSMTRAEWVTMIVRALGIKSTGEAAELTDVSKDSWYYETVQMSYSLGLLSGYPDGSFRPNHSISRAELAVIISRLSKVQDNPSSSVVIVFADDESLPAWARHAIYNARLKGWMNGNTNNEFHPQSPTTRADAMVVLSKIMKSGL